MIEAGGFVALRKGCEGREAAEGLRLDLTISAAGYGKKDKPVNIVGLISPIKAKVIDQ